MLDFLQKIFCLTGWHSVIIQKKRVGNTTHIKGSRQDLRRRFLLAKPGDIHINFSISLFGKHPKISCVILLDKSHDLPDRGITSVNRSAESLSGSQRIIDLAVSGCDVLRLGRGICHVMTFKSLRETIRQPHILLHAFRILSRRQTIAELFFVQFYHRHACRYREKALSLPADVRIVTTQALLFFLRQTRYIFEDHLSGICPGDIQIRPVSLFIRCMDANRSHEQNGIVQRSILRGRGNIHLIREIAFHIHEPQFDFSCNLFCGDADMLPPVQPLSQTFHLFPRCMYASVVAHAAFEAPDPDSLLFQKSVIDKIGFDKGNTVRQLILEFD